MGWQEKRLFIVPSVSFTALQPRQQKGQQKQPETAYLLPIVTASDGKPAVFQKH